jgi:dTDP-4-dehydrorhamnose 3,5-epimerase
MRRMETMATRLEGPLLLAPSVHGDRRGFFLESFRESAFDELGLGERWVQDNHSRSARGVVRGMHFQVGQGQAKLVRCVRGAIFDVLVDLRRGSPTWGQWEGHELNDENHHQLYVPVGFAHGFCVTSELADVTYKCSSYYDPAAERSFRYDDPEVGIGWPVSELIPSERDSHAPLLSEIADELPFTV